MLARGEALKRGTPVGLAATSPVRGAEFNGGWTVFVDANGNGVLRRRRDDRPRAAARFAATCA